MAISTDYPKPVTVNGFVCRNCDDVADARKFIDPAAPKDGATPARGVAEAVSFGGTLVRSDAAEQVPAAPPTARLLDRYA